MFILKFIYNKNHGSVAYINGNCVGEELPLPPPFFDGLVYNFSETFLLNNGPAEMTSLILSIPGNRFYTKSFVYSSGEFSVSLSSLESISSNK